MSDFPYFDNDDTHEDRVRGLLYSILNKLSDIEELLKVSINTPKACRVCGIDVEAHTSDELDECMRQVGKLNALTGLR